MPVAVSSGESLSLTCQVATRGGALPVSENAVDEVLTQPEACAEPQAGREVAHEAARCGGIGLIGLLDGQGALAKVEHELAGEVRVGHFGLQLVR